MEVSMELKYKFSYGSLINFILNQIIIICYHAFTVLCLLFLVFVVFGTLDHLFKEQEVISIIIKILPIYLIAFWLIYLTIILFIPKKAIIKTNFIKVRRYFLNFSYLTRGFNDEIFINDIIECKKYDGKRYRLDRTKPYAVFFFDWDSLIEIKTKDDKCYLVPLQNSADFIKEVNARIERTRFFEKYKLDSVIAEKGIQPEDIKVRWKSQGEIESIYYMDKMGNKVEIALRCL